MAQTTIDKLIINSPYIEPVRHWSYDRENRVFNLTDGRREAGYVIASPQSKAFDDPGIFVPIELANKIRPRVEQWRESGYPGITGITKRLLEHWQDPEERKDRKFFFCQLEAIETLIWYTEAPDAEKVGIDVPGDGGDFVRWCCKMATGSGKTIVMAMVIAWQILNKVTNQQDKRFSKNILVVAPGLTVKSRLAVLNPNSEDNYFEVFNVVPHAMFDRLRQGKVLIHNWHSLAWDSDEKIAKRKSVDKRGAKSDEAYVREVLGDMAGAQNILVINDEAHHAWRIAAMAKTKGIKKEEEEATVWVGGLDRINRSRGILRCIDFSATPFAPSGKQSQEEALFPWIVSDFGLNDAIEAGLVKTPRVVVRDDSFVTQDIKSRLYHIYMDKDVKDDINRKAQETEPLPDLILNAYNLLGKDWLETLESWQKSNFPIPPVMITVANTTYTSSRIKYAFDHGDIHITELCDQSKTLQIDSRVLDDAESQDEVEEIQNSADSSAEAEDDAPAERKLTKKEQAELLRRTVNTVGKTGQPGEQIRNVISVGMLSEGWDAQNVTHIMGLRAFSSQLLCEQVVGRGLRRTSYDVALDGLFEPEYVNIFGVPFTFLPHEGGEGTPPPPPPPKTKIEPVGQKAQHEITFPNVIRIDHVFRPVLTVDMEKVKPLELDPYESITEAHMADVIEGKPMLTPATMSEIDLKELEEKNRIQTIIFKVAKKIYNNENPNWKGRPEIFLIQLIRIVEGYIKSDRISIKTDVLNQDERRKKILILLNMNKVVQNIWDAIRTENAEKLMPVFDDVAPVRTTSDVRTWYTSKPCEYSRKSHVNFTVYDSTWEASEAFILDKCDQVESWVKNDHLGFAVLYNFKGVIHKYFPDFIIRMKSGKHLILETKGQDDDRNRAKRSYLAEWVKAVNEQGGFGEWSSEVSFYPGDLEGILSDAK
jgi:type III restriction enzyme